MSSEQRDLFRACIEAGRQCLMEATLKTGNTVAATVWRLQNGVLAAAIGYLNAPAPEDEEEARGRVGLLMLGAFGAHEAASFAKGETDAPQFHFQPQVHQAQNN